MRRRWAWFLAGLGASVAVTAALWSLGVPGFFLFLAFPFLFLPLGRGGDGSDEACPSCGARRQAAHLFCPACGARLP